MQRKMLVACNNALDSNGLANAFSNLEEIELLPLYQMGEPLWTRIREERPSLVLLDLFLPNEDSLIVLDRIAACPIEQRPMVLIMSALSDDRLLRLVEHRALYCFLKPLHFEQVQLRTLELLHAVSGEPRPHAEEQSLERIVAQYIRSVGVPAHLKGYHYLVRAVCLYGSDPQPLRLSVTNDIYPVVAREFKTDPPLVEHAIRNAIEIAWTRGNLDNIDRYFGYTVNDHKGKPSNFEFIAMIAEHVRHERM